MRKVLYILGVLQDSDLQWLIDVGEVRRLTAGTEIIHEGGPLDSLFIVLDGELDVTKGNLGIATLSAGEVVGEMSLLDSRPPAATVTATGEAAVFAVPRRSLRAKLERDTEFAARFYRALCVFLANRLGRTNMLVGARDARVAESEEVEAGMGDDVLDTVGIAGARFDWFRKRLMGAQS
jgi:CRP/FNR family cyclic AMP-dependent transcriptional regulator